MLVTSLFGVATGTLHRLFKMKQFICLLILLVGVLKTHATPIHLGIGAGGSLNTGGLENLPSNIVSGAEGIVNEILGSSSSSEASVTTEASASVEVTNSTSIAAQSSTEPAVPAEASESSSSAAESSSTSAPVESSSVSTASTTSVPSEPSAASSSSSIPAETSPSPTSSSSTESPAPSESTGSTVTSASGNSTNSTTSGSTESPTTPESENPNTCLGSCPAVDSYDSVYLVNERCDKFCQCSNGRAIVLSCPDGLHFNRVLNVCDWPINAQCVEIALLNK